MVAAPVANRPAANSRPAGNPTAPNNRGPNNSAANNNMAKSETKPDKTAKKPGKSADRPNSILQTSPELRNTLAAIEKQFGEGSIMPLGADRMGPILGISTGSLSL
ncbi:MAG TPA: hypothetical protein VGI40_19980, partial [Pirellulaceae bacterium]